MLHIGVILHRLIEIRLGRGPLCLRGRLSQFVQRGLGTGQLAARLLQVEIFEAYPGMIQGIQALLQPGHVRPEGVDRVLHPHDGLGQVVRHAERNAGVALSPRHHPSSFCRL